VRLGITVIFVASGRKPAALRTGIYSLTCPPLLHLRIFFDLREVSENFKYNHLSYLKDVLVIYLQYRTGNMFVCEGITMTTITSGLVVLVQLAVC
jgi:hypothetical protein